MGRHQPLQQTPVIIESDLLISSELKVSDILKMTTQYYVLYFKSQIKEASGKSIRKEKVFQNERNFRFVMSNGMGTTGTILM